MSVSNKEKQKRYRERLKRRYSRLNVLEEFYRSYVIYDNAFNEMLRKYEVLCELDFDKESSSFKGQVLDKPVDACFDRYTKLSVDEDNYVKLIK